MADRLKPAILAVGLTAALVAVGEQTVAQNVRFVTVVGCASPGGEPQTWMLTSATEGESSGKTGAAIKAQPGTAAEIERATETPLGDLTYRLLGTSQYNLDDHTAHKVLVKGLLIVTDEERRLNVTSIQHVDANCTAS